MSGLTGLRIAFIGGGVMGEAVIHGVLSKQLTTPEQVIVSEPVAARREHLHAKLGIATTSANLEAVTGANILLLAVKPQILPRVLSELAGQLAPDTLLLSIVAGATLETLQRGLGLPYLAAVRIMPNTPAQVGEGISVWTTTPSVSAAQREQARELIGALGQEIYVEDEHYLDMATALSGSGPAYVLLFIEALADVGVQMGFARPVAERLALQTVRGTAIYAQQMGTHPAVLRNMVTSPGGTTAAALHVLEKGGLRATLAEAVLAAYARAQELGKQGQK
jgi:pyrroline-5-carboxylate reductase